jgi:hypothetical protein
MALPLFKEKRLSTRLALSGLLPGRLLTVDGKDVDCKPKDVSKNGFGIQSDSILPTGAILILKMKNVSVQLEVAWSQPGFGKRDQTRYGLVTKDMNINLEQIFIEAGCLK